MIKNTIYLVYNGHGLLGKKYLLTGRDFKNSDKIKKFIAKIFLPIRIGLAS